MQVLNISPRMIFGNLDHFESLEDFQKITVMLDYIKSFVDKSDLKTLECVYKYIKKLDKNKDK
ncbi:hypothetical protein [Apilactobacillus micheneri]|nr:hypothetical protein [Apilactobacillus micheneri]